MGQIVTSFHQYLRITLVFCVISILVSCGDETSVLSSAQTVQYDVDSAYLMASLSMIAYDEDKVRDKRLKERGYGVSYVFSDKNTNTEGFITIKNHKVLAVFRGTKGLHNLFFTNGKCFREKGFGGKVHKGFKQAFDALKDDFYTQLRAAIKETPVNNTGKIKIIFTGHSLGAALAQLFAYDYDKNNEGDVDSVYLYGSPRVGDVCYMENYNQELGNVTYQHMIEGDRVTDMPPRKIGWQRWAHTGKQRYILDPRGDGIDKKIIKSPKRPCKDKTKAEIDDKLGVELPRNLYREAEISVKQILGFSASEDELVTVQHFLAGNHEITLYRSLLAVEPLDKRL